MLNVVMSTTKDAVVVKNLPLSVRLEPGERIALCAAARRDDRSLSSMTRLILIDWLRQQGYLHSEGENNK